MSASSGRGSAPRHASCRPSTVEDPLLCRHGGFLIDGQRTAPSDLSDHFQIRVAAFEGSGYFKTKGRFADTMASNHSDFHWRTIVAGVLSFEL